MIHRSLSSRLVSIGAYLAFLLAAGLLLSSCRNSNNGATPIASTAATVNLSGAGATFPYPLYSKWFDTYNQAHSDIRINYQSIGSGGGIKQLMAGTVDFGASDAPLSNDEVKQMPAKVVHLPMVAGAVALAYNLPGVENDLHLTPEVIAGMFLGTITKWNDQQITALNPKIKLPATNVTIAHRSDGSGTSYIFTNYLAAISSEWKTKVGAGKSVNWPVGIGGKGNEGVAGVLKQTPGSIGYVELAYATQNKLTYASIRKKAGQFVAPRINSNTAAAASAGEPMKKDVRVSIVNSAGKDAYPIAGFTYILLYQDQKDATKGQALATFLTWAIHEGQQYAEPLMYAPLPSAVVTLDEQALKTITLNGKPIP